MAVLDKTEKIKRSEVVNMRVEPNQLDLIDSAASLSGKTRSAFMLDAAYRAAEEALLDRRLFRLSDEQWKAFNKALDTSPTKNEKLIELLQAPTPWE
ncbi:DUF1778 domain-containing protein [Trichocoleus sp. FACHB-90]|uniref:type II toxin-antitoxin system TacA family antitoxin n=1 Tax=Cyanophyceae TaxID=3028117 RepID=UPI001684B517|nr:DUF1778 domain-containing protein [Trichocoleus sp. FACHB-90]MBD1925526.1 DUF1778 domain-containing protein [Trichocoleus sp. FACHB-90]